MIKCLLILMMSLACSGQTDLTNGNSKKPGVTEKDEPNSPSEPTTSESESTKQTEISENPKKSSGDPNFSDITVAATHSTNPKTGLTNSEIIIDSKIVVSEAYVHFTDVFLSFEQEMKDVGIDFKDGVIDWEYDNSDVLQSAKDYSNDQGNEVLPMMSDYFIYDFGTSELSPNKLSAQKYKNGTYDYGHINLFNTDDKYAINIKGTVNLSGIVRRFEIRLEDDLSVLVPLQGSVKTLNSHVASIKVHFELGKWLTLIDFSESLLEEDGSILIADNVNDPQMDDFEAGLHKYIQLELVE